MFFCFPDTMLNTKVELKPHFFKLKFGKVSQCEPVKKLDQTLANQFAQDRLCTFLPNYFAELCQRLANQMFGRSHVRDEICMVIRPFSALLSALFCQILSKFGGVERHHKHLLTFANLEFTNKTLEKFASKGPDFEYIVKKRVKRLHSAYLGSSLFLGCPHIRRVPLRIIRQPQDRLKEIFQSRNQFLQYTHVLTKNSFDGLR